MKFRNICFVGLGLTLSLFLAAQVVQVPVSSPVGRVVSYVVGAASSLGHVLTNRVLDLGEGFTATDATLTDLSPESNNATLYTGRYVSTDGVNDKVEFTDLTLSAVPKKVSARVRSGTDSDFYGSVGGVSLQAAVSPNGTWQDVEATFPSDIDFLVEHADKMWFDGVDNRVNLTTAVDLTGDFTITATYKLSAAATSSATLFSQDGSNRILIFNSSGFRFYGVIGGVGGSFPPIGAELNDLTDITITRTGTTLTISTNHGYSESITVGSSTFSCNTIGALGPAQAWYGLLYDVNINDQLSFDGTISDGNAIGTANGSPQTLTEMLQAPTFYTIGSDGTNFFAGDLSDVKLLDAAGNVLHRAQLNEHHSETADTLDGLPAFDSSGSGNHGSYVGCAGFTGEGIDPDFVGAAYEANEDKMWFDGVDDYVEIDNQIDISGNFNMEWDEIFTEEISLLGVFGGFSSGGYPAGFNNPTTFAMRSQFSPFNTYLLTLDAALTLGKSYRFKINRVGNTISLYVDGVLQTNTITVLTGDFFRFDYIFRKNTVSFPGVVYDVKLDTDGDGNYNHHWQGYGNTDAAWLDQVGTNHGTVLPTNPATIGQKRATILQTAGMDWNREVLAYESEFTNGVLGDLAYQSNCTVSVIGNDYAEITVAGSGITTYGSTNPSGVFYGPHPRPGVTYRISFEAYLPSGNTEVAGLFFQARWGAVDGDVIGGYSRQAPMTTTDQWVTVEDTITIASGMAISFRPNDGTYGNFSLTSAAIGDTFRIRNFSMVGVGILVPASDSNPATDSIGNAITKPRVNNKVLNLFGDGEYARFDPITLAGDFTIELFLNHEPGVIEYPIGRTTDSLQYIQIRDDRISFSATGQQDVATTVPAGTSMITLVRSGATITGYLNALSQGTITDSGTITLDSVGNRGGVSFLGTQVGAVKIYDAALTPDDILVRNFNTQAMGFDLMPYVEGAIVYEGGIITYEGAPVVLE